MLQRGISKWPFEVRRLACLSFDLSRVGLGSGPLAATPPGSHARGGRWFDAPRRHRLLPRRQRRAEADARASDGLALLWGISRISRLL